ncbi:MAG TPA: hypothetical protein DHU55_09470 [Blastocatellia bacterium]|jgi:hypothetical protein|nr:hypothetical protein [Blastocatellia bacterium]HAF23219.1 hypothetical protein [Blastocatellia bacterium]HCX29979.1 hypothetical protein [Blastocatellia bacterium]
MKSKDATRKGKLVAQVLSGAWRKSDFPALVVSERELDEVTPSLCKSGVAALSWHRISRSQLQNSPSAEVLHQAYRLQSLQSEIQEQKIEKVFRLLRQASVEAILVKGWAAAGLYTQRDLRPYGDIDICVGSKQFDAAKQALSVPEAYDCSIDLHKHFSELEERTTEELFARSSMVNLGREQIRILCPEDHLALLCIHLLKHGAWRPLWLCDISAALETLAPNFDWEIFLGSDRQRASWIACAIGLAHRLLGAKIETLPLEPGLTEVPGWLVQNVLYHWSRLVPGDHLPMQAAPLMVGNLREGRHIFKAIVERWPDPITATFNLEGQFNNFPRWPYQFVDFIRIASNYLMHLPAKLQSDR